MRVIILVVVVLLFGLWAGYCRADGSTVGPLPVETPAAAATSTLGAGASAPTPTLAPPAAPTSEVTIPPTSVPSIEIPPTSVPATLVPDLDPPATSVPDSGAVTSAPGSTGISDGPAQKPVAKGAKPKAGVSDASDWCVSEKLLLSVIAPQGAGYQWEDYPGTGYKLAGTQGEFLENISLGDIKPGGRYHWIQQVDVELQSFTEMSGGDDDAIVAPAGKLGTLWIKDKPRERFRCITR